MEAGRYDPAAFGLAMYAEFIRAGVEDMPEVKKGRPASDFWNKDVDPIIRVISRVNPRYGEEFGKFMWKRLVQKFKNLEAAENAMQEFMIDVLTEKKVLKKGVALSSAKTWVLTGLKWKAADLWRKDKRRSGDEPLQTEDDDGELVDINLQDPSAWQDMDDVLGEVDIDRALDELVDVNPKLPEYIRLRLKGDNDREVAEAWGVSPAAVLDFKRRWLPRAQPVIDEYIREAG
jgi:DNA-directed RNA polymerase specialized sigma24 family protein